MLRDAAASPELYPELEYPAIVKLPLAMSLPGAWQRLGDVR
jgi:hypothetical protein